MKHYSASGVGRMQMNRRALWADVIRENYGDEERGWSSCAPKEGFRVGLWRVLRKWRVFSL